MKTKVCSKCKEEKSINEFSKNRTRKDGLNNWCKECVKEYDKKYRLNNKEKIKEIKKRNYQKNREQILKQMKEYYKANPIKIRCRNTISEHKRRGFKILFNSLELLSLAEKIINCPICDVKLNWEYGTKKGISKENSPSLDRINNQKVLTKDNVQIICRRCNTTKQDRTMPEFINYCEMVVNKFK